MTVLRVQKFIRGVKRAKFQPLGGEILPRAFQPADEIHAKTFERVDDQFADAGRAHRMHRGRAHVDVVIALAPRGEHDAAAPERPRADQFEQFGAIVGFAHLAAERYLSTLAHLAASAAQRAVMALAGSASGSITVKWFAPASAW